MAETTRTSTPPAHDEAGHLAPEDIDSRTMLYEESFYDSRQTALLLGGMGLGFVILLVILYVIGFGG